MSRNPTAYFVIVGTLAFALPGAANAGPPNRPLFNMLRPQPHFNMLRPQISMPPLRLSHSPNQRFIGRDMALRSPRPGPAERSIPSLGGAGTQSSSSGNASAIPVSTVSGGTSGGASSGTAPSRFRVIEDGGHFAVVERRSEKIVAGGFESYKAASAWIANHV